MRIHRINSQSTAIESSDVPDEELDAVTVGQLSDGAPLSMLAMLQAGEAVFHDGFWIFGPALRTANGMLPVDPMLEIKAGFTPRSGAPGSCDTHWIEVRQLVKRSAAAIATGIEVRMNAAAGHLQ